MNRQNKQTTNKHEVLKVIYLGSLVKGLVPRTQTHVWSTIYLIDFQGKTSSLFSLLEIKNGEFP